MTGQKRKRTGTDERVRPKVVVYDPELTTSLPATVTCTSTFNVMAHCFAALWSPTGDPLTSALAADAIRAVVNDLPAVQADPSDIRARSGLCPRRAQRGSGRPAQRAHPGRGARSAGAESRAPIHGG